MTEYLYPATGEEALHLLNQGRGRIIAGGTDLLPDVQAGKIQPDRLIDITRIPTLRKISFSPSWVTIGAAVTFAELRAHPRLKADYPALTHAAASVGAGAIQRAATWAGNLIQAMPAADGAIVALALKAEVKKIHNRGEEWLPVEDLFRGPGQSTVDPTQEIITAVRFSRETENGWGISWQRVGRRQALVLPIINCAAALQLDLESSPSRILTARIALGPVSPRPFRARKAERYLVGRSPTRDVIREAAVAAREEANPRTSVMRAPREYRLKLTQALVSRALGEAAWRAKSADPTPAVNR